MFVVGQDVMADYLLRVQILPSADCADLQCSDDRHPPECTGGWMQSEGDSADKSEQKCVNCESANAKVRNKVK